MSILLITAFSLVGLVISYQAGKLITAPWRELKLPKYVFFKYTTHTGAGIWKRVDLYYRGQLLHTDYASYEIGDPVKNMRKVQRTLLRRFKATSMCGVFLSKKD